MKKHKIISTSDLHGALDFKIPSGNILTISGDLCPVSGSHHPVSQENWIKNHFLPWCDELIKNDIVKHIVLISGNHDFYFEKLIKDNMEDSFRETLPTGVHYLRDSMVDIDGIKIYGTPFTPIFMRWCNMLPEEDLDTVYSNIPEGLDILLSHGPAYEWNDMVEQYPERFVEDDAHLGSKSLHKHILRAKPKWLINGHIHTGSHNITTIPIVDENFNRTEIKVINVSLLDEDYYITYKPFEFTIVK